jgi:hypothetical protein
MGSQRVAGEDRAGLARSAAAECDDKVDWRRIGGGEDVPAPSTTVAE